MKPNYIGSVKHLKEIRKKIQYTVRPAFSLEEKLVLSAIISQEIVKRNLIKSYSPQLFKMGINVDEMESPPPWMK